MKLEAKFPRFFKIILHDSIRDGKVAIPKKFVRNYGDELSNYAVLKLPTGEKWRVDLMKHDGEIWFANDGWQEFIKNYSLDYGSVLVFEFDKENYHFNIIIFDKSSSEIIYPYNNLEKEFQEPIMNEEEEEEEEAEIIEVSAEILNKTTTQAKNSTRNYKGREENGGMFSKKQRLDDDADQVRSCSNLPAAAATDVTKEFNSTHPFFSIVISSNHLEKQVVYIPSKFAINIQRSTDYSKLQVGNRCWPVKLILGKNHRGGQFSGGWVQFARENSLQVGDVCVFELIDSKAVVIRVSIFK